MNTFSRFKLKSVFLTGGLIVSGLSLFHYTNKHIKYKTAVNNVVTEYCEMALRSDSRILNYCGNSFKINHYEITNTDRNIMTVRLQVSGNRGKCKVLAKCEKNSHKYLKSHFQQQLKYSLLSKEEKNISIFTPINYNDVLIPDKKLIEKIKSLSDDKDIFSYHIDKYNLGYYSKLPQLNDELIKDDDEFWRITSLVLVSKDSMIFNVRPISNKVKNYDLEDTFYKLNTYQDVIHNVIEFKDKYFSTLNKKLTNEEFRREVNQMKLSNLDQRGRSRKIIIIGECMMLVVGFISVRLFMNKVIPNHPGYHQAVNIVKRSGSISKILGSNPIVLYASGNMMFSRNVEFKLNVLGPKNGGIASFKSNDEPNSINSTIMNLRNNEVFHLKNLDTEKNNQNYNPSKSNKRSYLKEMRDEIIENIDEFKAKDKKNKENVEEVSNDSEEEEDIFGKRKNSKKKVNDKKKPKTSFFNNIKRFFRRKKNYNE